MPPRPAQRGGWAAQFTLFGRLIDKFRGRTDPGQRLIEASGLFDKAYYRARYSDVAATSRDLVSHYLMRGAAEGRDPNPLFDTNWYVKQHPEVVETKINPLVHYLTVGAAKGYDPSPLFDTDWYTAQYPAVAENGRNPLADYLTRGAAEDRDPNPLFDTGWYLTQYPDVAAAGIDPLVHYISSGADEGRDPNPLFDTDWYTSRYPEIRQAGINPLAHYLTLGVAEARDPNPLFDTDWYLTQYHEVAEMRLNPLADYLARRVAEGRDPSADFDTELYLAQLPKPERTKYGSALEHYLREGHERGLICNRRYDAQAAPESIAEFRSALSEHKPSVLMVCHSQGGGTEKHVRELAQFFRDTFHSLMLKPRPGGLVRLSQIVPDGGLVLDFDPQRQFSELVDFLRACRVERVHVHHEAGHEDYLRALIGRLGRPFDLTLHDYFALSPHPHLIGPEGRFVGDDLAAAEPQLLAASDCPGLTNLRDWQEAHRWLLVEASRIIAPSEDAARRYRAHLPRARITVAPHLDRSVVPSLSNRRMLLRASDPLRIAMIGALSPEKGYDVVLGCADLVHRQGLPLAFTVIGYSLDDEALEEAGVTVTGRYDDDRLDEMISGINPGLIWFPAQWPETYSYTLTTALRTGLPLVVPRLGAFPERVQGRADIWVEPWDRPELQWVKFFMQLRDRFLDEGITASDYSDAVSAEPCSFYAHEYWAPALAR